MSRRVVWAVSGGRRTLILADGMSLWIPDDAGLGGGEVWCLNGGSYREDWSMGDSDKFAFIKAIEGMSEAVHATAKDKGFWDEDRSDAEAIALMHSELSEALESIRHGHPPDKHCPAFSNTEVEFADLVIRVLDTCAARGYRLAEAVLAKHAFNGSRPHKHGKTF